MQHFHSSPKGKCKVFTCSVHVLYIPGVYLGCKIHSHPSERIQPDMVSGELEPQSYSWCLSTGFLKIQTFNPLPANLFPLFLLHQHDTCMQMYICIMLTFIFRLFECAKEFEKQLRAVFRSWGGSQKKRSVFFLYRLSVLCGTTVFSSWHRWKNLLFGLAQSLARETPGMSYSSNASTPVETSHLQVESYIHM